MKKTGMIMSTEKDGPECGEKFTEKIEYFLCECERCIGKHEE